ncbi:MAG: translation initiation factor eIF-1A [Candidatus Altiarchaeota archaeon]|nr:translation initiation factor eIF-1A [Candidatus Altiarchaeota archaeon]
MYHPRPHGQKPRGGQTSGDTEIIRVRVPRGKQLLGEVEQLLGDRRMSVKATDGFTRICRIPGKVRRRIWIKEGDIVLLEPWTVEATKKGDVLWRYTPQQSGWLESKGYLKGIV